MEGVHAGVRQVGNRIARLLHESDHRAGGVELHNPPGRRIRRVKNRQGRDRVVLPVTVDERSQIEIRDVVGVARQEELFTVDPPPVGEERAGAAQQLRLEVGADRGRRRTRGKVAAHHVRKVVEIDENLVDSRAAELVEPDVEQGPTVDDQHALRGCIGDRPQAAADTRGEQEGLHASAFRTTPRARIRAFAPASTPSRPSMPSSQAAYAATDSTGVCRGSHPSARSAPMSDRMCRVSPKRYSPVTTPAWSEPYWRMTTSANSRVVTALPPPTLKTRPTARSSSSTSVFASTTSLMLT